MYWYLNGKQHCTLWFTMCGVWFTVLFTSQHFILDGKLLTETLCLYHPMKYQHIVISNNLYIFMCFKQWVLN